MTAADVGRLSKAEVLALRGLRLPALALKRLRESGIYCDPSVSIQHQNNAQRYVIRGVESGGAVEEIGAYCSFVGFDGCALPLLQKIQSVGRNGLHAVVVAPEFVRLQMFRNEQTYQLLITRHHLESAPELKRPMLVNKILFHGIHGTPEPETKMSDLKPTDTQIPIFRNRAGDVLPVPEELGWTIEKLAAATACFGCRHCHLLNAQKHPLAVSRSTEVSL